MKPEIIVILAIFIGFILLEILFTQFFRKEKQVKGDGWVDLLSTLMLTGVTQPAVLFMGAFLATLIVPQYADVLKSWHWLPVLGLFLIFDDMTQYWWHRFTHRTPWLYNLHRPHHQAEYLSIRIVYRNNIFYYFLMPGLWFSGILIYLGGGWVAISYSSGIYYSERRKLPANIQKNSASKTCRTQASQNNSSGRSSRRNNPN